MEPNFRNSAACHPDGTLFCSTIADHNAFTLKSIPTRKEISKAKSNTKMQVTAQNGGTHNGGSLSLLTGLFITPDPSSISMRSRSRLISSRCIS
jgi:hypothetical protein